ncbi:MAG: hypothetical protein H6599_11945 [Flavobacteriales bacterium]|nr:hypothetical protein [Flavobacteriales bacterium]
MGLFDFFKKDHSEELNLSEKLEKIGYFDLIKDIEKKKYIKEKIDFDFEDDSNQYIGKGWLTFPNDYYISSVYNLTEYKNGSPTSDFRAFEVWASSLVRGEFLDYLKSAKVVFERNNIRLEYKDETFDENTKERIHHKVTVNEKEYIIFSGQVSRDNIGLIMKKYLDSFRNILNDVIKRQSKDSKVILVTQPECVMFVLLKQNILEDFKKIVKQTKNKIEE